MRAGFASDGERLPGQWSIPWNDREAAIHAHLPLVQRVLRRMGFNGGFLPVLDREDLLSFGIMGLLEASDRFDPRKGVPFEAYAITRIRGAILDGIRAIDPLSRVARQRSRQIDRSWSSLAGSLGREPTADEICRDTELTMVNYRQAVTLAGRVPVSLDATSLSDSEGEYLRDPQSEFAFEDIEKAQLLEDLAREVRALPERELLIVSLYYKEGLRSGEIALVLGVSASRVHQLHTRALGRLRKSLRERYAA